MEQLAENRTIIDKSIFREGMLAVSREGYGKAARKAMLVFLGLWVLFLAVTLISGGSVWQTMGSLGLVGLIGLWICVYLPRYNAGRFWKAQEAKYGPSMERLTRFYPEYLTITGEGVEQTIAYADIARVLHSRRLIVLVSAGKAGILLDKRGFSGKTEEELLTLIRVGQA